MLGYAGSWNVNEDDEDDRDPEKEVTRFRKASLFIVPTVPSILQQPWYVQTSLGTSNYPLTPCFLLGRLHAVSDVQDNAWRY